MAKYIDIELDGGKARFAPHGFKGRECVAATAPLEKALGTVVSDVPTPEMHQRTAPTTKQTIRPGGSA